MFFGLTLVKTCMNFAFKMKFFPEKFCWFGKKQYLCTRFRPKVGRYAVRERVL